jgi:DNA-binding response OmpR family regulator
MAPPPANAPLIHLVEDDELIAEFVTLSLEPRGYAIRWARSGQQALDQLDQGAPALMLLDLSLPGIDGFGVLERIQAREAQAGQGKPFPIIIMTGQDTNDVVKRALALGATGYLPKPFGPPLLLERVLEQLRR